MLRPVPLLATVVFAGSIPATTAWSQSQQTEGAGGSRTVEAQAAAFLEEKGAAQQRMIDELRTRGIQYGQVRSIIAKYRNQIRANDRIAGTQFAEAINEAFLTEVAIELAVLGFGPSKLRPQDKPDAIFEAAAAKIRNAASPAQLDLLAEHIVEGTLEDYTFENPTGPSAIYMLVRVEHARKGDLSQGDQIRIPLRTRRTGADRYELASEEKLPPPRSRIEAKLSKSAARLPGPSGRTWNGDDIYIKIADIGAPPASGE